MKKSVIAAGLITLAAATVAAPMASASAATPVSQSGSQSSAAEATPFDGITFRADNYQGCSVIAKTQTSMLLDCYASGAHRGDPDTVVVNLPSDKFVVSASELFHTHTMWQKYDSQNHVAGVGAMHWYTKEPQVIDANGINQAATRGWKLGFRNQEILGHVQMEITLKS